MDKLRPPLYNVHKSMGASMTEFAGWEMPLLYSSAVKEHLAVREAAGVFDVSHMGRVRIVGVDAYDFLDRMIPKNLKKAKDGRMVGPTALLNERGGFKDDVMLYRVSQEEWLMVCNAVNREKVLEWLRLHAKGYNVRIEDITLNTVMLALQGPRSGEIMERLGAGEALELEMLRFKVDAKVLGVKTFLVSRSGWTGEDGFEIWVRPEDAEDVWKAILREGAEPAGLAARDSLRMEMGFVLYGEDIDEDVNPVEARYWVFSYDKTGYIGFEGVKKALEEGVARVRVGFKLKERIIPRHGAPVYCGRTVIGHVTSGAYSPTLKSGIAQGYVKSSHSLIGLTVYVEVRGKIHKAKIVDFPFITR